MECFQGKGQFSRKGIDYLQMFVSLFDVEYALMQSEDRFICWRATSNVSAGFGIKAECSVAELLTVE